MELYIVRRTFKSNGVVYEVGSVVTDLTKIRRHKTKIKDRKLIRLSQDPKKRANEIAYIESRSGKNLKAEISKIINPPKPKPKAEPKKAEPKKKSKKE